MIVLMRAEWIIGLVMSSGIVILTILLCLWQGWAQRRQEAKTVYEITWIDEVDDE